MPVVTASHRTPPALAAASASRPDGIPEPVPDEVPA
jgi:hypothetical protein